MGVVNLHEVREVLTLAREFRATRVKCDGIEVEMSPLAFVGEATPAGPPEAPACPCGHEATEHSPDGLCLRGCAIERCAVEERP